MVRSNLNNTKVLKIEVSTNPDGCKVCQANKMGIVIVGKCPKNCGTVYQEFTQANDGGGR